MEKQNFEAISWFDINYLIAVFRHSGIFHIKTEKIFLGELSKGKRRAFIVIVGEGLFAQLIDNKFV